MFVQQDHACMFSSQTVIIGLQWKWKNCAAPTDIGSLDRSWKWPEFVIPSAGCVMRLGPTQVAWYLVRFEVHDSTCLVGTWNAYHFSIRCEDAGPIWRSRILLNHQPVLVCESYFYSSRWSQGLESAESQSPAVYHNCPHWVLHSGRPLFWGKPKSSHMMFFLHNIFIICHIYMSLSSPKYLPVFFLNG